MALLASDIPALIGHTRQHLRAGRRRAGGARRPGRSSVTTLDGTPVEPEQLTDHLGPRGGAEGWLRGLHVQGDARAAPGGGRHAARPARPGRRADPRRDAARRRGPARDRQGLHRRLRLELPRRAGGEVRHRAMGEAADRGRHRQRVPLPRPGAERAHALRRACRSRARRSTRPRRCARRPASGAKVLVVSNVVDSSMARAADGVLYTRAGPEIGVASTKCHLAQIVALEVLGLVPGPDPRDAAGAGEINEILNAMEALARRWSSEALTRVGDVDDVAAKLTDARDFFFLGRHVGYPDRAGGRAEAEGAGVPAGRGVPGGRAQARADRADRAGDGGRGHRHAEPAVGEDALEHRRGAQPRGDGGPGGRRRRRGVGGGGRPRAVGAADRAPAVAGGRASCRCSSWPTGWPACTGTTRTARATWPRR